jgi:hypothetical protein
MMPTHTPSSDLPGTCRWWPALLVLLACGTPAGDDAAPDTDAADGTDAPVDSDPQGTLAAPHLANRLSAVEIRRSLRDVLGVDVDVAAVLPPDALLHGFDHADAATTLTGAFVERWADLVGDVVDLVLAGDVRLPAETAVATVGAEALAWSDGQVGTPWLIDASWWVLQGEGDVTAAFTVPDGGPWDLDLAAVIAPADGGTARLRV